MGSLKRCFYVVALCTSLLATSAWGGGLWLYEEATPDLGTAAAGRAALANDASTAAANPAGMTRLERSQMLAGLQGLFFKSEFDSDSTTFSGGDGGDSVDGRVGCRATNRAFNPAPFLSHVSHERSGESENLSRRAFPNRRRPE